jgi:uncharacterized damage-inducible protein DinB
MTIKTQPKETISTLLTSRWEEVGRKLETLAREFPESQYEFRPAKEVRTFGDVLRHVAFWNRYVADTARGRQADDAANELSKSEFSTKARVIEALNASTAEAAAALRDQRAELDLKTAELVATFIEHNCEHYGQLVVYARLNGIVPPASRG